MRVASFDLAARGQPKSLGCTFMCFQFWHRSFLIVVLLCVAWRGRMPFFCSALVSLRSKDDEHLVPFHPWSCFDLAYIHEILLEFLQNPRTQFTVRHLASAK